jgi:hypothetical protein
MKAYVTFRGEGGGEIEGLCNVVEGGSWVWNSRTVFSRFLPSSPKSVCHLPLCYFAPPPAAAARSSLEDRDECIF